MSEMEANTNEIVPTEIDDTPATVEQSQVNEAYQRFMQKCADLGISIYRKHKQDGVFETERKNLLFDIDKLASKHDRLLAKQNKAKKETTDVGTNQS